MKLFAREDRTEGQILSSDSTFVFGKNELSKHTYNGFYLVFNGAFIRKLVKQYMDRRTWMLTPTVCYMRILFKVWRPTGSKYPRLWIATFWTEVNQ